MKATIKQLAMIWQHFQHYYSRAVLNMPKDRKKEKLLQYFNVRHITDIPRDKASEYISEIRIQHRVPVGYHAEQDLLRDWNIKESEVNDENYGVK